MHALDITSGDAAGLSALPRVLVGNAAGPASLGEALRSFAASSPEPSPVRANPGLALWHELLSGTWSLVDRFERADRHCFVARQTDPSTATRRALTPRERIVVTQSVLGCSHKSIAIDLRVALSTVAQDRANAMRKLGIGSLPELAALLPSSPG